MKGTVQIVDIPDDTSLVKMTEQVIANNFKIHKSK